MRPASAPAPAPSGRAARPGTVTPLVAGAVLLALFELAHVWFIMPLPGSQRVRSVGVAYALYRARWAVRALAGALLLVGLAPAWRADGRRRAVAAGVLVLAGAAAYAANGLMAADQMFRTPERLDMRPLAASRVSDSGLVVGVVVGGDARAYPVRFLGYHHQVYDTVGGRPVVVTYCTVCRTGRAFSPVVGGRAETFRLVGMDQFNAMLEDHTTGSWWRQANGEAVAGPRTGAVLEELPSRQVTLARWRAMYPTTRVMQPDPASRGEYAKGYDYERGASRGALTGTDRRSWREKSWVVGVAEGGAARAYDWNRLRRERVVHDTVGGAPVLLALAGDGASFAAFRRPSAGARYAWRGDSLVALGGAGAPAGAAYGLDGRGPAGALAPVQASQEFWHSWRTFHPGTTRY